MNKNDIVTALVTSVSYGGNAVARVDGQVVFVPRGVKGDLLKIRIVKVTKSYCFGRIEEIVSPAPSRAEHPCETAGRCGCCFADFGYETELEYKQGFVKDAFSRIACESIDIPEVISSPVIYGYRNKVMYPVASSADGKMNIGFYRPRSHAVVNIDGCMLHSPVFEHLVPAFRKWAYEFGITAYDEISQKGLVRHLCGKTALFSGETVVIIVINGSSLPHAEELTDAMKAAIPGLSGIVLNYNTKPGNEILGEQSETLWGKDKITEKIGATTFTVSTLSFFQINPYQVETLYNVALKLAKPAITDKLLDLCCGVGTITQFFAPHVAEAVGVEIVADAVADATENAKRNGIANCRFVCGDAGETVRRLSDGGFVPDIITLDPARRGLGEDASAAVAEMGADKIVYISCDPTTQARDVKVIVSNGYRLEAVQPVDMFPRTYHVENVCLLIKKTI